MRVLVWIGSLMINWHNGTMLNKFASDSGGSSCGALSSDLNQQILYGSVDIRVW
jgi:hypothetical protein